MISSLSFKARRSRRATAGLATIVLAGTVAYPVSAQAATSGKSSSASKSADLATPDTAAKALARAHATGKAVSLLNATTSTSTLTAEPDGTLSLVLSPVPVRKKVGSAWQDLDATLVRNADGSISPRLSDDALSLSGGGTGPLVTMTSGSDSLALTLPSALPTPSLSGDTATYANVALGIDLVITASTLGGFTDTFVVHNAAAAASPALTSLLSATVTSKGLTVAAAPNGTLTARDARGRTVFAANTPTLWDSSTTAASAPASGTPLPATSTVHAPGRRAHVGRLAPSLSGETLTLSPDPSVLHGAATSFPVFIDPPWNPVASNNTGWATVAAQYPTQSYWDTTAEGSGYMAVGYGVSSSSLLARSLVNFPLPASTLAGSTVTSAVFSATNEYSGACADGASDEVMNVDAPSATLTKSNADWNDWSSASQVGSSIGSKSFAYGYSTSCASGGSPSSVSITLSTTTFQNDIKAGKQTQTLALVAGNESSGNSWKDFIYSTAKLTLNYAFTPTLTEETADSGGCGTQADPSLLGKGSVQLIAGVYQKQGSSLTTDFWLYNADKTIEYDPTSSTGATKTTPSAVASTSGTNAILTLQGTFFNGFSTTSATTFAWSVKVNDATPLYSSTVTCYFTYDPTVPGKPQLNGPNGDCNASAAAYTVGQAASFTAGPGDSGANPTVYYYQLNDAAPVAVSAPTGTQSFSVKPTSGSNVLSIDAADAAGNVGEPYTCYFTATPAALAADHDMNGDGATDLVTTGTGTGTLPNGLWLAGGNKTGAVAPNPTDIGVNGDGLSGTTGAPNAADGPADYAGSQAVVGQFTGNKLNDVMAYYPPGVTLNGTASPITGAQAQIVTGTGDGTPLQAEQNEFVNPVVSGALIDPNGNYPTQIANAYNADTNDSGAYPDLIATAGGGSSSYLSYYPSSFSIGGYAPQNAAANVTSLILTNKTPDTTSNWSSWTLATAQVGPAVDLYLWNSSTGALYLWTGIGITDNSSQTSNAGTLTYAQSYAIDDGTTGHTWNKAATFHAVEAADVNGDGIPDLWTVNNSGSVTPYLVTAPLSTTANATIIAPGAAQSLATAAHDWPLNDYSTVTANASQDNAATGATPLTAVSDATYGVTGVNPHTEDLFTPDVDFTNSKHGELTSGAKTLDLTKSFTVSVWTKPEGMGLMTLSEDGTAYPGLMLYPTPSGWDFYLAKDNGAATWGGDAVVGGSVQLGTWAHLQATYNATTDVMSLYVDGVFVAYGSHAIPTSGGAPGPMRVGGNINNGAQSSFYTGQVAELQTWSGAALTPNQPYTPASYHQSLIPQRILKTSDTTNNAFSGAVQNGSPLASDATYTLPIVGDTVKSYNAGTVSTTTIPASATAAAIDVTLVQESSNGNLIAYADGSQRPITSSTNYAANTTVTGYQIVPIGPDGKIALYNYSSGTTQVIVDITGYFTSDSTLTGDQTYTQLGTASRVLNTRDGTGVTQGVVPANTTFTFNVKNALNPGAGVTITGVAINLTTANETGYGYLEVYPTGQTPSADTALTYTTNAVASMAADVPVAPDGTITIDNVGSATNIIGDVAGYYTTNTTGLVYHSVNPTRLVDTRYGFGGHSTALQKDVTTGFAGMGGQITSNPRPILALMLTATNTSFNGNIIAYPDTATQAPNTSNLNWNTGQTVANLAVVGIGATDGGISIYNNSTGTLDLIADCSGYFAAF